MTYAILAGWYAIGLMGWFLVYRDNRYFLARVWGHEVKWCPAPKEILLALLAGLLGVGSLIVGVAILLTSKDSMSPDSWWHRPVCDR